VPAQVETRREAEVGEKETRETASGGAGESWRGGLVVIVGCGRRERSFAREEILEGEC